MEKIITMSLLSLMLVSFASASYNFDYEKPSLDEYSNSIFNAVRLDTISVNIARIMYGLLTTARFYENKLYECETELKTPVKKKSNNGRSYESSTETEEEQEWSFPFDLNGDGIGDLQDFGLFKECKNEHFGEEGNFICDLNNDGIVDIQDISLV